MNAAYMVAFNTERTDKMYGDQYDRLFIDDRIIPGDMPIEDILGLLDVEASYVDIAKDCYENLWRMNDEIPSYADIQEYYLLDIISIQEEMCMEFFGDSSEFWENEDYREQEIANWVAGYMEHWGTKIIEDLKNILDIFGYAYIYSGMVPVTSDGVEYSIMSRSVVENNSQQKLLYFPMEDIVVF